jgi:hypothetical protein
VGKPLSRKTGPDVCGEDREISCVYEPRGGTFEPHLDPD